MPYARLPLGNFAGRFRESVTFFTFMETPLNMIRNRLMIGAAIFCLTSICLSASAQDLENPGEYMSAISKARGDMDTKYMQYLSAAAHGRRARKIEKLRMQVLESITTSRYKTTDLPMYKGDNSLRKGSIDYIQMCYRIFDEDYKKIVNMEELAEQSFDEMQAYLLLQEKVSEKLNEAAANLEKANTEFAAKYKVQIINQKSELGLKMDVAAKLNQYTNDVFLVFFKSNWQDGTMTEAMNNKKVNDIEQARSALASYSNEGLKALDTLKMFNGDPTLANACRDVLKFYKDMSENEVPKLTDFYLKQENFEKIKKSFDAKSASSRTKEDVDAYNKAVNEMNNAVGTFNKINNGINTRRTAVLNGWQNADKKFSDTHMPYYR